MAHSSPVTALRAGGIALLVAGALAACDSHVGIEGTDYSTADSSPETTQSAESEPSSARAAPPPAASTIALVQADPDTSEALNRWATDLQRLAPGELEAKCWTVAPQNVESMYKDKTAILTALAQPGTDNGSTVVWKSPATAKTPVTVVADHTDIATGYACPRVYPAGTSTESGTTGVMQTAAARHIVRRYLSRQTGQPLAAADQENSHPLLCTAGTEWDPYGRGTTAPAPLTTNPNAVAAPASFVDQSISSSALNSTYLSISARVTANGAQQERTYIVKATDQGYCLGDVSA